MRNFDYDPVFARSVAELSAGALDKGLCRFVQPLTGSPVPIVGLLDQKGPERVVHELIVQQQSHLVQSPDRHIPGEVTEDGQVTLESEPQRLLIASTGMVALLTRREQVPVPLRAISRTRESILRSDYLCPEDFDEALSERYVMDPNRGLYLQARLDNVQESTQRLLRTAFPGGKSYVHFETLEDPDDLLEIGSQARSVQAVFLNRDFGVQGTISNFIDLQRRNLIDSSVELSLLFDNQIVVQTHDGSMAVRELDLSIEGNNMYLLSDATEAGFTSLQQSTMELVARIIEGAKVIPWEERTGS